MADRYATLARTPVGRFLVKNLGLPSPAPLCRYEEGPPRLSGRFLVGGAGHVRADVVATVTAADGEPTTEVEPGVRYQGLVFDATGLESPESLSDLREFFSPVMRSLDPCPHVVVIGTAPAEADPPGRRIAQRGLEGFTRSLAKEIGRGGTVQLVSLTPGADSGLPPTLEFLLSFKSAYVSGQVVRIGPPVAEEALPDDPLHPLAGRVAVVTGAARGIGAAIARTLHRDGATVVGVDVPQAASDLHDVMKELGGDAVLLDITTVDAPQRLARTLRDRHRGVDVVVHNAGITRDRRLANMDERRWSSVIDVNVTAPQRITTELLDAKLIHRNGRVIGVASIAGIAGNAGQTNYATSKAAVIGLVDAFAPLAAEQGVTVNAVAPGFIETQMTAAIPLMIREAGRRMNSMSQAGLPVDVAETVAWLAHPGTSGVTGTVVRVCGQSLLGA